MFLSVEAIMKVETKVKGNLQCLCFWTLSVLWLQFFIFAFPLSSIKQLGKYEGLTLYSLFDPLFLVFTSL